MYKLKKNIHTGASGSKKSMLVMIMFTAFMGVLPLISSDNTNLDIGYNDDSFPKVVLQQDTTTPTSTTFFPVQVVTKEGTLDDGNLASLLTFEDGDSYNVSEDSGADPLRININFTGVDDFDYVIITTWYMGGAGHEIELEIWDFDDEAWEGGYLTITDEAGFTTHPVPVFDPTDHIEQTNVSIRLRHVDSGNPSHDIAIDFAVLNKGTAVLTSNTHNSLSGRELDSNHPQYLLIDGTRSMTGNLNIGANDIISTGDITADKLIVDDSGTFGSVQVDGITINNNLLLNIVGNIELGSSGVIKLVSTNFDADGNDIVNVGTLTATTLTDGTLDIIGGEILDATTLEATTTLGFEIGDVQQLYITDGYLRPTTDDDVHLGDHTHQFKNLYLDGIANIDTLTADSGTIGSVIIGGGTWTGTELALYDAGDDKTLTFIHDRVYPFTTSDSTITFHTDANDHYIYLSRWAGHNISVDQDLRHDAGVGATFSKLTITSSTPTLLRKLQLGDTGRSATAGEWIFDGVGKALGTVIGSDGKDGEGLFFEGAVGQASQYAGTSGDGGGEKHIMGSKGVGLNGANDGVDGKFEVIGKSEFTGDLDVSGKLYVEGSIENNGTFITHSPTIFCGEQEGVCFGIDYVNKEFDWCEKDDKGNWVCDNYNEEILNKINQVETKKEEKEICLSNSYQWDGGCYETERNVVQYNDAVEVRQTNETNITDSTCLNLNQALQVVSVYCAKEVITNKIIDVGRFKDGCDWKEEIGYYCNERIPRLSGIEN